MNSTLEHNCYLALSDLIQDYITSVRFASHHFDRPIYLYDIGDSFKYSSSLHYLNLNYDKHRVNNSYILRYSPCYIRKNLSYDDFKTILVGNNINFFEDTTGIYIKN